MGDGRNARVVRCVDGAMVALTQQDVAASMVAVMMGDQDGGQGEPMGVEKGDQPRGIAGIHRDGVVAVVPYPDVVVVERGQGNEGQHDGVCQTGGRTMLSK